MYQVIYIFNNNFSQGVGSITTKDIKLYDVENAEQLQFKIDEYLQNNHSYYHKNIKVLNISKL